MTNPVPHYEVIDADSENDAFPPTPADVEAYIDAKWPPPTP